ncbi:MAG: spondin domain-containing protein [Pseudomonadota bacterium]
MKNFIKFLFVILFIFQLTGCGLDALNPLSMFTSSSDSSETYKVTLLSTWSGTTHPKDFPANASLSKLIGINHNSNASLWSDQATAISELKKFAEGGDESDMLTLINSIIDNDNARNVISADGLASTPGSITLNIEVDDDFPLVTLISKISPSPDWFVGVSGLSLIENEEWVETKELDLYVWDAGTDSGTSYESIDIETLPPELIHASDAGNFMVNGVRTPIGTLTFERQ